MNLKNQKLLNVLSPQLKEISHLTPIVTGARLGPTEQPFWQNSKAEASLLNIALSLKRQDDKRCSESQ
jgi:hypothetical protein